MAWSGTSASRILSKLYPSDDPIRTELEADIFPLFLDGLDDADGLLGPFLPTPLTTIAKALDAVPIADGCRVLELGSGDGRVAVAAALHPRVVQAVGIELDQALVDLAVGKLQQAEKLWHLEHAATTQQLSCSFLQGDMYQLLSPAVHGSDIAAPPVDVTGFGLIILYLLPEAEEKLASILRSAYQAGAIIVSVIFSLDLGFRLIDQVAGCYIYGLQA